MVVRGTYVDWKPIEGEEDETDVVFESEQISAKLGFWYHKIDRSMILSEMGSPVSLSMDLYTKAGDNATETISGPTVTVSTWPKNRPAETKMPENKEIKIVLPIVLCVVLLCVAGTCIWNRKTRHIDLGNVMSRRRRGGAFGGKLGKLSGRSKQRAEERIQLMEREIEAEGGEVYRDLPHHGRVGSEGLGSLAGTPTEDRRMEFKSSSTGGGSGNQFREELIRQERKKD